MCLYSNNDRGSILVEALAAVAIIAVSLTLIMQSFASTLRASVLHQDYIKALVLLQNRLEATSLKDMSDLGIVDKPCPEPFGRFHYKTAIKDVNGQPLYQGLKQIDIAVDWPSGPRQREVKLSTYLNLGNVEQKTKTTYYGGY